MNFISNKIALASLATALAGSAQIAQADSSAQAHIDWNSLTIQYFDLSFGSNLPSLSWSDAYGSASSYAFSFAPYDEQEDYQDAGDLSSSLSAHASTLSAQSDSLRDEHDLTASAASQASTTTSPFIWQNNYSQASSANSGNFQLTGHGIALITLNWSASGSSTQNDGNDYADAHVYISGNFSDGNGNNGGASTNYSAYAYQYNNGAFSQDGTFSMAVFGDGIHTVTGYLNADVSAYSQSLVSHVPVPAAAWMFASGLLGWVGVSRRKTTAV